MLDISRCVKRLNAKGAFLQPSRWAIAGFYPQPFDPTEVGPGRIFVLAPEAGRVVVRVSRSEPTRPRLPRAGRARRDHPVRVGRKERQGAIVAPGTYRFDLRVVRPVLSTRHMIIDSEEMRVEGSRAAPSAQSPGAPAAGALQVPGIAHGGASIRFSGPDRGGVACACHDPRPERSYSRSPRNPPWPAECMVGRSRFRRTEIAGGGVLRADRQARGSGCPTDTASLAARRP